MENLGSEVLGIQDVNFKGRDGQPVEGKTVFLAQKIPAQRGRGQSAERIFLSTAKLTELGFVLDVGMSVEVLYNRYGKVHTLRRLDNPLDFGA